MSEARLVMLVSPESPSGLGVRAASFRNFAILQRFCCGIRVWVFSSTGELSFPRFHRMGGRASIGRQMLSCIRRLPCSNAPSRADFTMHGTPGSCYAPSKSVELGFSLLDQSKTKTFACSTNISIGVISFPGCPSPGNPFSLLTTIKFRRG